MSEDGKILNRGLDALLGSSSTNNQRTIKDIDPGSINAGRFQPRANFDDGLQALRLAIAAAESLKLKKIIKIN